MKTLELNQMENLQGGKLTKCEVGVIGGCAISTISFTLALGQIGALWGVACTLTAAAADTCEGKS